MGSKNGGVSRAMLRSSTTYRIEYHAGKWEDGSMTTMKTGQQQGEEQLIVNQT